MTRHVAFTGLFRIGTCGAASGDRMPVRRGSSKVWMARPTGTNPVFRYKEKARGSSVDEVRTVLTKVVEDPTASGDVRAGAAVALRTRLDEEGKARVRIAAEATASPQLRVALEAVAGESDEVAGEALAELAQRSA